MKKTNQRLKSADTQPQHAGFAIDEIFNLTRIDKWLPVQIKEIVDFEEELAVVKN
ncbi:MAG TPA: hypothetical protein VN761_01445 [Candidatus Polarisedimenticolia bacterium]|nr:hypothetical protein [Candidatus Polarisedimenticolia bacterium]